MNAGTETGRRSPAAPRGRRPLRVVQIITRLDPGGSSDVVLGLCERLDRERFEVTLLVGPGSEAAPKPSELAERLGIDVVLCPDLVREVRPGRDLRALASIAGYLRRRRPDVVHTHTSKAGALGRLAAAGCGLPVIHSPHGHLFYGYFGPSGSGLTLAAERMLAPLARRIAVLTETSRAEHLERGVGRAPQYEVVPSGIDLERFTPDPEQRRRVRAELGLEQAFVIGWIGRFTEVKAPEAFIEACSVVARRNENVHFLLAGDGELRAKTEALAGERGLAPRCRFVGWRADVPALLNACDLLALSPRNEGLGLAAVEAMACGVPVVATDVGGLNELLPDAALAPPDDPEALARRMLALIDDAARRQELAASGRERAQAYGLDRMTERFAAIYEELACGS